MRRPAIVVAACAAAVLAIPGIARAAAPTGLSPAARSLSRCVQNDGRLSVLMLVDESGSLRTTDPYNQRVDGVRAALTGLADLAETPVAGKRPKVSVLMAGFYGAVHPESAEDVELGDWRPVGYANVDQLLDEARQYESLNHGKATDYVTALGAAREMLAARVAEETEAGGSPPCQALIWFTDGRYSLPRRVGKAGAGLPLKLDYAPGLSLDQPGAGEKAVVLGKRFMCKPNGLMDGIQADGVTRFTVALSTDLAPEDAAFLRAATTGSGGGQRCGAHLSRLSGEYLSARDGDQLFFVFAGLTGPLPAVDTHPICPGEAPCVHGETAFETVPGLSRFVIRATGGAEGSPEEAAKQQLEVQLRSPDGQSVALRPDGTHELSLAGTEVTQRWVSGRAVEIEGRLSQASRRWLGRWAYTFVDPAADPAAPPSQRSYSSVQLFTDLQPAVEGSPVLIRGSPTKLQFKLTSGSSPAKAVTEGPLLETARLVATVEDPIAGTSTRIPVAGLKPDGSFSATVRIPPSSTTGFVYLGLTASYATASGTPIAPQFRSFEVPVRLPPGQGYPTVSPSSLELPTLRGKGTAEADLTVTGSSVSSGCVWIEAPQVKAPPEAGSIEASVTPVSSGGRCIRLAKGETRHFTVQVPLDPDGDVSGQVTAAIPVHLHSDIVETDEVVSVPLSFAIAPPRNEVTRVALLVGLILLGALLPLLLLHLLNRTGAFLTAPNRLRIVDLEVELPQGGSLRRRGEDGSPEIGRGETLAGKGLRPVRELDLGGVELKALASGSLADRSFDLFRGPYAVARDEAGRKLISGASRPLRSWREGASREVPLILPGTWIFRFDGLRPAAAAAPASAPRPRPAPDGRAAFAPWERPATEPTAEVGAPRPAAINGRLILLTSDGPPIDQAEVLFREAEQALLADDALWEGPRPEPAPAPEPAPDAGTETDREPVESPPPAPRREATEWQPFAPREQSKRKPPGDGGRLY